MDPMDRNVLRGWMWSEACEMLARAERLHREFFRPIRSASRLAAWEPPVDILETEREVLVLVARRTRALRAQPRLRRRCRLMR